MFTKTIPLLILSLSIVFFLYTLLFNSISNFNIIPDIKDNAKLITTGAYKYIRHPMYFTVIVTMFAPLSNSINYANISICTTLTITILLKIKKEEYLWQKKSKAYKRYMKKTKMLIPFVL